MSVEIISTVMRRRRWTPAEKVAIVEEAFGPGSSVAAAADRHGISRPLIYLWRRQARQGLMPGVGLAKPAMREFAPVRLAAATDRASASAAKSRASGEQGITGRVVVTLRNGRRLSVDEGIEPARLARLAGALDSGGS
jgi:transposase